MLAWHCYVRIFYSLRAFVSDVHFMRCRILCVDFGGNPVCSMFWWDVLYGIWQHCMLNLPGWDSFSCRGHFMPLVWRRHLWLSVWTLTADQLSELSCRDVLNYVGCF